METPTSPQDLYAIAGKKCNIFEYRDIADFDHIDELFEHGNSDIENEIEMDLPFDNKSAIILYKSRPNFGHWCMIKKNKKGYHFLDSYGEVIDDQLEHSQDYNLLGGQDQKYLAKLLASADKDVYYNHNPLQKESQEISTCGLYCALFLKYSTMGVDDFAKMIKKMAERHDLSNDCVIAVLAYT